MKFEPAHASAVETPEVVLNLWAYVDEAGYILRLAGKSYVMDGDDDDKLVLLQKLARTDFFSAGWCKVSPKFKIINPDGEEMTGVATASLLADPISHSHLFGPLIEQLASLLPEQLRSYDGDYELFRMELSQNPLCVTTVVMEYEDGSLIPRVSNKEYEETQ